MLSPSAAEHRKEHIWQELDCFSDMTGTPAWQMRSLVGPTRDALLEMANDPLADIGTATDNAVRVLQDIRHAFQPSVGEETNKRLWIVEQTPHYAIKKDKTPPIDKSTLEAATSEYLNLPIRVRGIERVLLIGLISYEMYQFGKEMWHPLKLLGFGEDTPITRPHPSSGMLKEWLVNGIFWLAVWAVAYLLHAWDFIGKNALWWTGAVAIALYGYSTLASLFFLPRAVAKWRAARDEVVGLLQAMVDTHVILCTEGPISTLHLRQAAQAASTKGVVWSSSVFAILDDNMRRDGRL
jgi:uncharacterized protein YjiS (DUF1127 family)